MNGSDLLIVLRSPGRRAEPSSIEGFRLVRALAAGAIEVHETDGPGERIDRREHGPHLAWVTGVTMPASPAKVLATWGSALDRGPSAAPVPLVGHFVALMIGPEAVTLWTDHLGTVAVFRAAAADGTQYLGTDLWTVATLARRTTIDAVSAREFLARGAVTSPFTLFKDVTRLPAASRIRMMVEGTAPVLREDRYWIPSADGVPTGLHECADALRVAVTSFVEAVTTTHDDPVVLLSGGEDSRAIAASARTARERGVLRAAIFLDHSNRELRLAQAAAGLLGVPLEPRWRPADQYTRDLANRIRMVGPGVDLRHGHSLGLIDPARDGLLLDGFGADFLTKAHFLPARPVRPGRRGSLREFEDVEGWRTDVARTSPTLLEGVRQDESVAERRRARLRAAEEFRPHFDAALWSRYLPLTDWATAGFFTANWMQRPCASPFLTGPAVDAIRGLAEPEKLNRALYQAAFGRVLGRAGLVPRSGGEFPGIPGGVGRGMGALVGEAFDLADRRAARLGRARNQGPWMEETAIQAQALRLLAGHGHLPEALSRSVLVGDDREEQTLNSPAVATRLLQLVVLVAELGAGFEVPLAPRAEPPAAPLSVTNARGVVLHVDGQDPRGLALAGAGGDLNPRSLAIWRRVTAARSWDLVVDVGANYGEMILGVDLAPEAQVVAYEPNPRILPFLRQAVAGQGTRVEVRPVAVSDRPGRGTLLLDPQWSGTARLGESADPAGRVSIKVGVVTLDGDLGLRGARTACLKVDVEGEELEVLAGAAALLDSLEDYCCLVEIVHLSDEAVARLSHEHALYLWDVRGPSFSRVSPSGPDQIRLRRQSGAYYPLDALLRPRHSSLPEALR